MFHVERGRRRETCAREVDKSLVPSRGDVSCGVLHVERGGGRRARAQKDDESLRVFRCGRHALAAWSMWNADASGRRAHVKSTRLVVPSRGDVRWRRAPHGTWTGPYARTRREAACPRAMYAAARALDVGTGALCAQEAGMRGRPPLGVTGIAVPRGTRAERNAPRVFKVDMWRGGPWLVRQRAPPARGGDVAGADRWLDGAWLHVPRGTQAEVNGVGAAWAASAVGSGRRPAFHVERGCSARSACSSRPRVHGCHRAVKTSPRAFHVERGGR